MFSLYSTVQIISPQFNHMIEKVCQPECNNWNLVYESVVYHLLESFILQ